MVQRTLSKRGGDKASLSTYEDFLNVWAVAEKQKARAEDEEAERLRALKVQNELLKAWEIVEQDDARVKTDEAAREMVACNWCRLNSC